MYIIADAARTCIVKLRRWAIDIIGYAMLIPAFVLYNYLEQIEGGYVAVVATVAAALPGVALWHYYHAKYT